MNYFDFIPTAYVTSDNRRILFRSKLEARWARYFDTAKFVWDYEPQQFKLDNAPPYTPDFLIHGLGWIEVKPTIGHLKKSLNRINPFIEQRLNDGERLLGLCGDKVTPRDVLVNEKGKGWITVDPFDAVSVLMGRFVEHPDLQIAAVNAMKSANLYRFEDALTVGEILLAELMKNESEWLSPAQRKHKRSTEQTLATSLTM